MKRKYPLLVLPVYLFFLSSLGPVSYGYAGEAPSLAKGVFLVAAPDLQGPFFRRSVVLIVEYEKNRTSGLIINKPSNHLLSQALPGIRQFKNSNQVIFVGGPLMPKIAFLLFKSKEDPGSDAIKIVDNIYFSHKVSSFSSLKRNHDSKENFRVYSGYSGWKPGQLEREILMGDWEISAFRPDLIFDKNPDRIWNDLIREENEVPAGIMARY